MSIKSSQELDCPQCGKQKQMLIWSTVNAIDTQAAQMVKEMRLNVFQCDHCGHQAFVDVSVLYHDMENKYCIQYVSKDDMKNPAYYANTLSKNATVILDPISQRILDNKGETYFNRPHFVFSTREMAAYIAFRVFCAAYGQEQ